MYDIQKYYQKVPEKEESDKLIIDNDLNKDTLNKDTKSDKGGSNTFISNSYCVWNNCTITEINTNNAITTIHDDDDDDDSIVINSTITTNNRYSVPLNSTNNINHVMTMNSIGEKGYFQV
ncbi:hypothetical protein BCR36DRAFT_374610 [Piromyces finnis]|uniref:Uncharacterized protein n=1 Tax=Piromyces finnis TaxID=1754191 RepID=A0A1Y1UW34_9FUNG|nr:hypothetical protein BCR36DRAFT_374610 [Piromyces finnis]|eukprot:ORX42298.1 hypothetical protein BCR36DRAFT_374610 [Piromyces finnis]